MGYRGVYRSANMADCRRGGEERERESKLEEKPNERISGENRMTESERNATRHVRMYGMYVHGTYVADERENYALA